MTNLEITTRRLANQHLTSTKFETAVEVVANLAAVQSQDYPGGRWALAQRMQSTTDAEIEQAFDRGEILRTHVLRPTWHFVTPADICWLLELTAPRVHRFNSSMYRRMELDDAVFKKSETMLTKTLAGGKHLTRAELVAALGRVGLADKEGLRLGLLLMHAELVGVICSGARRGKQFTYALLEERAPQAKKLKRDEALYELSRRYFSTRGPATAQDFAWWSGLTLTDARKGIESVKGEFETAQVEKQLYILPASLPPAPQKSPAAYLLPNYDEYFIAYQDRNAIGERVRAQPPAELNRALSTHIVFIDGQIVGGWKRTLKKESVTVSLHLLAPLTRPEQRAIETAAAHYAKFLGVPLELVEKTFDDKRRTGLFTQGPESGIK